MPVDDTAGAYGSRADDVLGHWGFVYEMDERGFASGELLLRGDGGLMRRYGSSFYSKGATRWEFGEWQRVSWWPGATTVDEAVNILRGHAYDLYEPGPVAIDERTAGPYPGSPAPARPIGE
jgi:hypothetical protein